MKRRFALITLALLLVAAVAVPPAQAASLEKMLKATYGVQILYNNQTLTSATAQPFIVDGTTYVPLRMLMNSFGDKQIAWDNVARRVVISSSTSQMETMYMQQISSRNAQITELQNKVKTLEAQLAAKTAAGDIDLDDLEDELSDDYGDYEDLDFEFTLSGDEDKITVKIDIDEDDWDALTTTKKESLLQDIADDLWSEAEDADIAFSIKDGSSTIKSLTVEADDDVSLSALDLDDLEDAFNDDYDSYEGVSFEYTLSGDEDDVTVRIDVDADDWGDLTDPEKEELLQDLADDVWDEAEDADISFSIKDGSSPIKTVNVDAGDDDINY